jgi:putative endonuclease
MGDTKQTLGALGESLVTAYVQKQGFSIVEKNYRIAGGEIDIIARHNNLYIFIEVKTRTFAHFHTSSVITDKKQASIVYTAQRYIAGKRLEDIIIRFDVAIVHGTPAQIDYIPNAFTKKSW